LLESGVYEHLLEDPTAVVKMKLQEIHAKHKTVRPTDLARASLRIDMVFLRITNWGISLRPTVISIGFPCYVTTCFHHRTLSPLVRKSESFVKNSGDFIYCWGLGTAINSVVSCLTSVPGDIALQVVISKPRNEGSKSSRNCWKFVWEMPTFMWQKYGVDMGNPYPLSLATNCRVYVCHYRRGLDWWLDLLTTYAHDSELHAFTTPSLISTIHKSPQHPLWLPACCVFISRSQATASNSGDRLRNDLSHLGSLRSLIYFVIEMSPKSAIHFLDVTIMRSGSALTTAVSKKGFTLRATSVPV
jgi:hypothetical protein